MTKVGRSRGKARRRLEGCDGVVVRQVVRGPAMCGTAEVVQSENIVVIVMVGLRTCRSGMVWSSREGIDWGGECRRRAAWGRRIRDRSSRPGWLGSDGRRVSLRWLVSVVRVGYSRARDRGRAFRFDGHWRENRSGECDGSHRARAWSRKRRMNSSGVRRMVLRRGDGDNLSR